MATTASTPPAPEAKGPRICRAVEDLGGDILRDCLYFHIKPPVVLHYVNESSYFKNHPLNQQQMTILGTASITGDYSGCDITLMYTLLQNLAPTSSLLHPTAGWGKVPVAAEYITLGDDIERIRDIRNEIYDHVVSTDLSDAIYNSKMKELQNICIRMDTVHKGLLMSPTSRLQTFTQTLSDIQVEMEERSRQELVRMKETDTETIELFCMLEDDVSGKSKMSSYF